MDMRLFRLGRPANILVLIERPGCGKTVVSDVMISVKPAKGRSMPKVFLQRLYLAFSRLKPKPACQNIEIGFAADSAHGLADSEDCGSEAVVASIVLRKWVTNEEGVDTRLRGHGGV